MSNCVFITGATGNVGSKLTAMLSEKGCHVKAAVHSPLKAQILNFRNVEPVRFDFLNPHCYDDALMEADRLVLITPFSYQQAEFAKRLIDKAKEYDIRHIVRISADGFGAQPGIQIMQWHQEIEDHIRKSGIGYTILRPNIFMDNFLSFLGESIRREGKIYSPQGQGRMAMIDCRDVAAAAAQILTATSNHVGKVYTLTGKQALSNEDIASAFSEVLGRRIEYVDVPSKTARDSMIATGTPDWMVNATMELNHIIKHGLLGRVSEDVQKILSREPIAFEQFVSDNKTAFTA